MDAMDIDSFALFEDEHNSLISNAIAECQDFGFNTDDEFRKKYLNWDLTYIGCYFIFKQRHFKRFDDIRSPKVRQAQEYFGELFTLFAPKWEKPSQQQDSKIFKALDKTKQAKIIPFPELTDANSPFDAIRHNYPNGEEFWTARELMNLLKIRDFGMFKDNIPNSTISQAMAQYEAESLEGESVGIEHQFCKKEKDWELTAIACYLIFIRVNRLTYPEVVKAQEYFAKKVERPINPNLELELKMVPNVPPVSDGSLPPQENQESGISPFDSIRRYDKDGNEYWTARDLMDVLGYRYWENFGGNKNGQKSVVKNAIKACINSGIEPNHHFFYAEEMVKRPQGGGARKKDWNLSRYACYLLAMNGDPDKPEIAMAQSYFATKTRKAELIEQAEAKTGKL